MEKTDQIIPLKQLTQDVKKLLSVLDARSQDIITRRYGLRTGKVETLDSIGQEYGITRERVRQIESQAKKLLSLRQELLAAINDLLTNIFQQSGGLTTIEHLTRQINQYFNESPQPTLVVFFLDILPQFKLINKSSLFKPHWSQPKLHHVHLEQAIETAQLVLQRNKQPLNKDKLFAEIRTNLNLSADDLPDDCLRSVLEASKRMSRTVFNEWGLTGWVETKPRGVGDKAYVVLLRLGKPMHFSAITEKINEVGFDHKVAHRQTVHNELIKDDRFILVGRGLYGLSDWGYIPGTVADVMTAILEKASAPLSKEQLLKAVLQQRMVKKTTILLGLQNNAKFKKLPDNKYTLRV